MSAEAAGGARPAAHGAEGHPGYKTYLLVAAVLGIITAAEVAVFYIPALAAALVPILLTLSTGKFILVVMFYMHLKFDSRIFTGVFVAPLLLAMAVVVSLIILFRVLPAYSPP
ncbi:MAG: cytochrome C oxidase subunit IV family protein [Gemmatimonadetes bacterium]|nr:cytochrome C oxidase subunit IV family protein [Gemmatimonadota bacterium]